MASIITLPLSSQLTNGTTADATQVMADLNAIANSVNLNAAPLSTTTSTATLGLTTGASIIGFNKPGVLQTVQQQLDMLYYGISNVRDTQFAGGAKGDGTTLDASAIQAALNAANTLGGGFVRLPTGNYNLGTTGLTTYQNVRLIGDAEPYISGTRGTVLTYSGTGNAIYGINLLNSSVEYLSLDCTNSTGAAVIGIYFKGAWLSTIHHVRVKGVTPTKGYGILIDTNAGVFGAQHNRLCSLECADGVIACIGTAANDQVTTTVLDTIRGLQYYISNAQLVFINATAEAWVTGSGYSFNNNGQSLMVGCDIEGAGAVGISIDAVHKVREVGTIWQGFTGATRVSGVMDSVRNYGGDFQWLASLVAGTAQRVSTSGNQNLPQYVSEYLFPVAIVGGAQEGYRQWRRYIAGAELITHEWQKHAFIENTKSFSATTAVTVLTVPIVNGRGMKIACHVEGTQIGEGTFSISQNVVAMNSGGTVTATGDAALKAPTNSLGVFTFTAGAGVLLIQWTPGTANTSTINFNFELRGPISGYTKG